MRRVWLDRRVVQAIHAEQIAEHGDLPGVRDEALLESALARRRNKAVYIKPSGFELAAAYAFGLARNHPFADGNKRTALVSAFTFLELNGWEVTASEEEAVLIFLGLAADTSSEAELAAWLQDHTLRATER
jgi:death on curing protein